MKLLTCPCCQSTLFYAQKRFIPILYCFVCGDATPLSDLRYHTLLDLGIINLELPFYSVPLHVWQATECQQ